MNIHSFRVLTLGWIHRAPATSRLFSSPSLLKMPVCVRIYCDAAPT